jgi:cob(I)alamin adenosyltransferase
MERTEAVAREAWRVARDKIASGGYQLVVLDEITYPINWGWIPVAEVVSVVSSRPATVNVIATGRDAPPELVDIADTVTEMRNRKHAFDAGIRAIRGIDF